MTHVKYPLFKVHVPSEQALEGIKAVFESGFINEGEQVTELTKRLSERLKQKHLCLVNSCTSALTLALKLAGVGPGDDVLTTPMTCVASNTPITNLGANVVWVDVDAIDGMVDGNDVKRKITEKTKALIVVAWAGTPPNLLMLDEICKKAKIKLILDAAHAFGATFQGTPLGASVADFTCYSFQAIKHFTTGDGGALVCRSEKDFKRAKSLKWFGLDRDLTKDEKGNWKGQQWDTDIAEPGFKFNMNNVAAAIGLAQLDYIDTLLEKHRSNATRYDELLKDHAAIITPERSPNLVSASWVYTVVLKDDRFDRDTVLSQLNAEGIAAGLVHVPNDVYTCFKSSEADLPGVRAFSKRQFSLPCGWWLTDDDVTFIASRLKELTT